MGEAGRAKAKLARDGFFFFLLTVHQKRLLRKRDAERDAAEENVREEEGETYSRRNVPTSVMARRMC